MCQLNWAQPRSAGVHPKRLGRSSYTYGDSQVARREAIAGSVDMHTRSYAVCMSVSGHKE